MKTALLKSNLLIKPSIVLAAAVFTAAFLPVPFAQAATDPLMPTGTAFDPNPAAPGSLTGRILTYGKDSDGNTVPLKTLRITNNTAQTVYPIMRDPNDGPYDPYDPFLKDYRGYIGYKVGTKYYFGLKTGQSILVRLPLVLWNGGRILIGTDGQYLTPPTGRPNPLRYDRDGMRSIADAQTSGNTIPNGVVMWYRGKNEGIAVDSEDQLAEWTVRDHQYLANPQITAKSQNKIPDNQLVTLINYDVSNVDSLYLPLAMEANDVWLVPQGGTLPLRTGWKAGSNPEVNGWTGSIDTIKILQDGIREFTADNNQLLGQYFGDKRKGWPFYNIPNPTNDPKAPRKIPSGANVFPESPLTDTRSTYNNDIYMLSSGGAGEISVTIPWAGGTPDRAGSEWLHLLSSQPLKFASIQIGNVVKGNPNPGKTNPIKPGTIVTGINAAEKSVKLRPPLQATSDQCSYTFSRPVDDYASEAMIRLWYSWAQYYRAHWKDRKPSAPTASATITGSIEAHTATLSFNIAHPELVEGMAVTGPGLTDPPAQTEKGVHQGDAVILKIASDQKSVILSQVPNKTSANATFTVRPPQSLLYTPTAKDDPGYPLIGGKFQFSNEPEWHDPYEFSQQVYLIMASMNQIGKPNNNSVSKYMQDIIGANMGFIFTDAAKKEDDAQMVIAMIRDMIKSVLRGVSNFTKYPDVVDKEGNHTRWYPNPAKGEGGQLFNVFNLDPFVWFVHVRLGFSGYGFSVDDDTADIGAGGASQLQLTVTGTGGLKNTNPWTNQAPWGPVKNVSLFYSGPASSTNGDTLYHRIASVSNTTPIKITTVGKLHLSDGDTVRIDQVEGDTAANGTFKIRNVTRNTFELFDAAMGKTPIAPSGRYIPSPPARTPGQWSYPLHPYVDSGADLTKVFYRVKGDEPDGTFQGTRVLVNGVDRNKKDGKQFRVWQLGRQKLDERTVGRLLLYDDLTDKCGTPLPAGTYNFTFFGIAETTSLSCE